MYVFSQPLTLTTIPKAYGFEAATRHPFTLTLSCGSLIPIVFYRDGDGFPLAIRILKSASYKEKQIRITLEG